MKRISFMLICLISACLLAGCGSYQLEEEPEGENEEVTDGEDSKDEAIVTVILDNPDDFPTLYPLKLYLFNSSNQCIYEHEIEAETDLPSISLSKGTYTMSAFSGLASGEYAFPMELHPSQLITFSENCCANIPLVAGKSHIQLNGDIRVSLRLSYAVACMYFSFDYFPKDVTQVTLGISPVSSGISLGGDIYNDNRFATIVCSQTDSRWESGPVYVMPSDANRIHLSVKLTKNGKETVYGYDYNTALKAGKVYQFVGEENGIITVGGEGQQVSGWVSDGPVDIDFEELIVEDAEDWEKPETGEENPEEEPPFKVEDDKPAGGNGDGSDTDGDETHDEETPGGNISGGGTSGEYDVLYANELPEAESIWGPFFVWKVEQLSSTSVKAILMAPRQWMVKRDEAVSICEAYEIDELTGWRVLTQEEAKEFRDQYDENIEELGSFLYEHDIDRFNKYDLRYLCDDFKSTFCFYNTKILDAGKTVKYGLRLFKEVIVELN